MGNNEFSYGMDGHQKKHHQPIQYQELSTRTKQKELEQTRTMDGRPNAAGTGILERKGDQKQPANRDGRGTANGLNRQEQQRNGQPEGGHPGDRVAGRKPHQTGAKNRKSASHTPQLQMMAKNFLRNKQAVPHMSSGHTAIGPVSA